MSAQRPIRSSGRLTTPQPTQPASTAATPSTRGSRGGRTRATRSASADADTGVAARPSTRTRRGAREASVESVRSMESANSRPRKTQTKGKAQAVVEELTTVEEDLHNEEDDDEAAARQLIGSRSPISHQNPVQTALQTSPGAVSNISGTTALSSVSSGADVAELDADDIVDELPSLYSNSDALIRSFAPPTANIEQLHGIYLDLQNPKTSTAKTYLRRWTTLNISLDVYAVKERDDDYIRPELVLRSLFGSTVTADTVTSLHRPDVLLQKTNLAFLAKSVLNSRRDDASFNMIRELDVNFPSLFLDSLDSTGASLLDANSSLLLESVDLGLSVRTQLLIMVLERGQENPDLDPSNVLEEVFMQNSESNEPSFRGWDAPGLAKDDGTLPAHLQEYAEARFRSIQQHLLSNDNTEDTEKTVDFRRLETAYPWDGFVERTMIWLQKRNAEIDEVVKSRGGIHSWQEQLRVDVERFKNGEVMETTVPQQIPSAQGRKSRKSHGRNSINVEGISALRRLREQAEAEENDSAAIRPASVPMASLELTNKGKQPAPQPEQIQMFNDDVDNEAGSDEEPIAAPQLSSPVRRFIQDNQETGEEDQDVDIDEILPTKQPPPGSIAAMKLQERHDKENKPGKNRQSDGSAPLRRRTFIDAQEDAQRVEFDDGFDESQHPIASSSRPTQPKSPRKRARNDESDDPSEDEGFQQDTRPIDAERRQKEFVRPDPSPPKKIARFESKAIASSSKTADHSGFPRKSDGYIAGQAASQRLAASLPTQMPPSSLENAQQQARQNMAMVSAMSRANRRPKRLWTPREEEHLVRLVGQYGCSWNLMLEEKDADGEKLFGERSNVDLKDKARNLKQVFIKSHSVLPTNFELVSLGSALENRLRRAGFAIP